MRYRSTVGYSNNDGQHVFVDHHSHDEFFTIPSSVKKHILTVHYFSEAVCNIKKKKTSSAQVSARDLSGFCSKQRLSYVFFCLRKVFRTCNRFNNFKTYSDGVAIRFKIICALNRHFYRDEKKTTSSLRQKLPMLASFVSFRKTFFLFGRRFSSGQTTTKTFVQMFSLLFGIGIRKSVLLCSIIGLSRSFPLFKVSAFKLEQIYTVIKKSVSIDRLLRKYLVLRIEKKKKINSYVGMRLFQNLPTRGQRTKTNAQTAKRYPLLRNLGFSHKMRVVEKKSKPELRKKKISDTSKSSSKGKKKSQSKTSQRKK
jgi:small subunit ribosomal protein S13